MYFKELLFAAIFAVITYQVTAEGNACSTKDSSKITNPLEVLGTYLGNTVLLDSYLSRFRSHPYMKTFNKHVREDAVSTNIMVALLALETAVTTSLYLGKKVDDTCELVTAFNLAVEYEKDHDLNKLLCAVDNVKEASETALYGVTEYFLQEVGCGSHYNKPVAPRPACNKNIKCIGSGYPTNYEYAFEFINKSSVINGVPVNPRMLESLKKLIDSDDKNLWGVAITWYGVQLHMRWLFDANISVDPRVFKLAVLVLQYMEAIAFSIDCSCKERVTLVSGIGNRLVAAIDDEMTFLKTSLKKKYS